MLRALAGLGLFAEEGEGRFRLTALGEPLRAGVPGSVRGYAVLVGEPMVWRSWGGILHSLRTGQPAFDHAFGAPLFEYLAAHPEEARVFDEAMTGRSAAEIAAVLAAYDFSGAGTVVDVGGGQGALLAAVLEADPRARGVLFDRPHVVAAARARLATAGLVPARCHLVEGDFFGAVPPGGDLYVLKRIIHDWDDGRARSILRNCRAAVPEAGRLLLVELVVPPGDEPSDAKLLDLLMLVYAGGRERTEAEYRDLLASAGFGLTRVVPTASCVSVVEAVPR